MAIIFILLYRLNHADDMLESSILTVNERVTSLAFRVSDIEQGKPRVIER